MWFLFIVSNTDTEINIWILLFIQIKSVCVFVLKEAEAVCGAALGRGVCRWSGPSLL